MHLIRVGLNCLVLQAIWQGSAATAFQDVPSVAPEFRQSIDDLSSPDFACRQRALESLKNASTEQIEQFSETVMSSPDNEVVRRLIEILEVRYQHPDSGASEVLAASESLEAAARSNRWFVAEAAREILKRHWKRRVELSVNELVSLKASLRPKDPKELWSNGLDLDHLPFRVRNNPDSNLLKIFIKESWPKGPRGMELLRRLEGLASDNFLRETGDIIIILVEGHPLSVEEVAILKGIFGDAPLQERGKVSLGIKQQARFSVYPGVTVGEVEEKSSAAAAGIRPGDVISAINGQTVPDFEALVTILRKFKIGDKVIFSVRQDNGAGSLEPVEIPVTLMGWPD